MEDPPHFIQFHKLQVTCRKRVVFPGAYGVQLAVTQRCLNRIGYDPTFGGTDLSEGSKNLVAFR